MDFLNALAQQLAAAGRDNSRRMVEELAGHVLCCRPLEIYFRDFELAQREELLELVARAEGGEPIQYLIGQVDFRGVLIRCDSRALIPRPETELLVEQALHFFASRSDALVLADVCTGSGCIALALASELPRAEVMAIDLSPAALELARENATRLELATHVRCVENDLLQGVAARSLDGVVANPPYIVSDVCGQLDESVRAHEPQMALDGGADGLELIRPLVAQARTALRPGGGLLMEIGYDQGPAVSQLLADAGFENVERVRDFAGLDRIVVGACPVES